MLYALDDVGLQIPAEPHRQAICPQCGGEVLSKCGQINIWHWAHKCAGDCDTWHEPETEWHLAWKELAWVELCEVKMGDHRADIRSRSGLVIELQNSPISPEEIREREEFYGNMIWIVNAQDFASRISLTRTYERDSGKLHSSKLVWKHPRESWRAAEEPVLLDLGDATLRMVLQERYRFSDTKYAVHELSDEPVYGAIELVWIHHFSGYGTYSFNLMRKSALIDKHFH